MMSDEDFENLLERVEGLESEIDDINNRLNDMIEEDNDDDNDDDETDENE